MGGRAERRKPRRPLSMGRLCLANMSRSAVAISVAIAVAISHAARQRVAGTTAPGRKVRGLMVISCVDGVFVREVLARVGPSPAVTVAVVIATTPLVIATEPDLSQRDPALSQRNRNGD